MTCTSPSTPNAATAAIIQSPESLDTVSAIPFCPIASNTASLSVAKPTGASLCPAGRTSTETNSTVSTQNATASTMATIIYIKLFFFISSPLKNSRMPRIREFLFYL